jgi:hypothetical protein
MKVALRTTRGAVEVPAANVWVGGSVERFQSAYAINATTQKTIFVAAALTDEDQVTLFGERFSRMKTDKIDQDVEVWAYLYDNANGVDFTLSWG